jgi:MFS family permease
VTRDRGTDGSISDKAGLGAFLVGLVTITIVGFLVAPALASSFCGLLVNPDDPVASIQALADDADTAGPAQQNAVWSLNQVGMCVDAKLLTGGGSSYPSTFALAFVSMMVGLLGGLAALAGRLWPAALRRVPQWFNEAVAGGSLGLAVLALSSMLDWNYAGGVLLGVIGASLVVTWILRRSQGWLAAILLIFLLLVLCAVVAAESSSSKNAWSHAQVVCLVVAFLAGAAIVMAKALTELRGWWQGLRRSPEKG